MTVEQTRAGMDVYQLMRYYLQGLGSNGREEDEEKGLTVW